MDEPVDWAFWTWVVSVFALGAALLAAHYYRRQARAAEGDLAPQFDMKGQRLHAGEMGRPLEVIVRNHNRQTIHIQSFEFSTPAGLDISFKPSPNGAFGPPTKKVVLKLEMPVAPISTGNPTEFRFVYRSNKKAPLPAKFYIRCTVKFRVGAGRFARRGHCAMQVQA